MSLKGQNNISNEVQDNGPKITQPKHKAELLVWTDLSADALDRLNMSQNSNDIKNFLAEIFMLDNYKDNLKNGIIIDLYYYTLQYARDQGFSPMQTSAFFSIVKKLFEACIETPYGNLDQTFEYFKELIHVHSMYTPPAKLLLFSLNEVRNLTAYVINTFFRHFKMYKYAFTPSVRLDLKVNYSEVMPPLTPSSSPVVAEAEGGDDDETPGGDEEGQEIATDEERQEARDLFKSIVYKFLTSESEKIEGNVDTNVKTAIEALDTEIDKVIGDRPTKVVDDKPTKRHRKHQKHLLVK